MSICCRFTSHRHTLFLVGIYNIITSQTLSVGGGVGNITLQGMIDKQTKVVFDSRNESTIVDETY